MRVNAPRVPYKLEPLQWGTVRAQGWTLEWARAARNGSSSPTAAVFAKIKGGAADGWLHGRPTFGGFWDEDSAYWIDGLTRLGLVLGDAVLLARVKADYEAVLRNPWNFHNLWPQDAVEGWVRSIYARGMLAYFDGTGDGRIVPFLERAYANYTPADSTHVNQDQSHQGSRSMTQMEALLEGYAYGGKAWMADLALALMGPEAENGGFAFMEKLLSGCLEDPRNITHLGCMQSTHGVTFNEVAKLFAMGYTHSGNASHLAASVGAIEMLHRYDVQPHGVNSAYEDLNGISPGIGTETCDVSDSIYTLSWMLRITGDGRYGDRAERAFYNAAPAAVSRRFTDHVYFQSPNYARAPEEPFQQAFYHTPPCCTGNQARMVPNFVHHQVWGYSDSGVAVALYGPSLVTLGVGPGRRANLTLEQVTDYPFQTGMELRLTLSEPTHFPLLLRQPGWAPKINTVRVNGAPVATTASPLPGFVQLAARWSDGDRIAFEFRAEITATVGRTVSNGWNGTTHPTAGLLGAGHGNVTANLPFCIVTRGPLLFALPLEDGGAWQYALECNATSMVATTAPLASPFDWPLTDGPVTIEATAGLWGWRDASLLPDGPVPTAARRRIRLIPYGSTKVRRISMFPIAQP